MQKAYKELLNYSKVIEKGKKIEEERNEYCSQLARANKEKQDKIRR